MSKTDIKIYSTEASTGKKQTTTIPYVNGNLNNSTLRQLSYKFNALTSNTYSSADKVVTTDLAEEDET